MFHNEHEQNEVHIDRGGLNSYVNVYKQVDGQSNVNGCKPGVGGWSKTWKKF